MRVPSYPRFVDTTTAVLTGAGLTAALVAGFFGVRNHRHARASTERSIASAAAPPPTGVIAPAALTAALDRLERSTAQAQRERSRLAGAVQAAPLGVLVTDDHGVVITSNGAAERFLGTRLGEAVAEVRVRDSIEQAILSRGAVSVEVELYTPVRSVLEVSAVALDFGIESVGAVAYVDDVTEERRVDAMRRDFVANVSHELKTPLAALAVLAETLAGSVSEDPAAAGLADAPPPRGGAAGPPGGRHARSVPGRGTHLARRAGLDRLGGRRRGPGDAPGRPGHGVALVVAGVPAAARVTGDSRQLRSILSNLVDNAIKYSIPGEGTAPPRVIVATAVRGDRVVIEVIDEGIGIAEGHLDRIFERFYRVDRARSRATGGTGLGLSIVRHIALNHGGDVTVASAEGKGSTFPVTLPLWNQP